MPAPPAPLHPRPARAQSSINEVNTLAHKLKNRLEALDKLNEEALKKKGCGPGSASERTRTSVTAGLKKKLKDLVGDFSKLRRAREAGRRAGGAAGLGAPPRAAPNARLPPTLPCSLAAAAARSAV